MKAQRAAACKAKLESKEAERKARAKKNERKRRGKYNTFLKGEWKMERFSLVQKAAREEAAREERFAESEEKYRLRHTHRLAVVLRRVVVLACVSVAQRQKYEGLGQEEPVSELLESLGDVPGDVLRIIVGFMGERFGAFAPSSD